MTEIKIPVLIVGGGGCGLTASNMLSNLGIEHVLIETHVGTSHMPKAHVLNQRTAEILDQHKLWDQITALGTPPEHMKRFHFATSLGGDGPLDRITLANPSCFGCNSDPGYDADYRIYTRDSAYLASNLPLIRLEPILRREAENRNPGRILFNHAATTFEEHADHVRIEVVNNTAGTKAIYIADYVIAADGGKTFGPALGIPFEGLEQVGEITTAHIKTDLSKYWQDGDLMYWLVDIGNKERNSETQTGIPIEILAGSWSTIVQVGPTWGKHSEEFVVHLSPGHIYGPLESLTNDDITSSIREALRIPDLDLEVLRVSRWAVEGTYATQYQTKRIFLAGDAVHRHPPTTGLGLNTAIGDAHNITFKLAAVLKGQASPKLLETYETERAPIGRRNAEWALFSSMNFRHMDTAAGFLPGGPEVRPLNEIIYNQLCSDTFDGIARRAAFQYMVQSQRVEYAAHDLELGGVYADGAIFHDGTPAPPVDPRGQKYHSIARPGHRLPHAWLQGQSKRISTHHLLDDKGSWLLLTDDSDLGKKWLSKASEIERRYNVKIRTVRIGESGEFKDENGQWLNDSGLAAGRGGAVLVRPDSYIAFRTRQFSDNALGQFEKASNVIWGVERSENRNVAARL